MSNVITIRIRRNKENNTLTAENKGLKKQYHVSLGMSEREAYWDVLKQFAKIVDMSGSFAMGEVDEKTKAFTLISPETVKVVEAD